MSSVPRYTNCGEWRGPNSKLVKVMCVKLDIAVAVNNLVLDNGFELGLTVPGVVCSDADVVGIQHQ